MGFQKTCSFPFLEAEVINYINLFAIIAFNAKWVNKGLFCNKEVILYKLSIETSLEYPQHLFPFPLNEHLQGLAFLLYKKVILITRPFLMLLFKHFLIQWTTVCLFLLCNHWLSFCPQGQQRLKRVLPCDSYFYIWGEQPCHSFNSYLFQYNVLAKNKNKIAYKSKNEWQKTPLFCTFCAFPWPVMPIRPWSSLYKITYLIILMKTVCVVCFWGEGGQVSFKYYLI